MPRVKAVKKSITAEAAIINSKEDVDTTNEIVEKSSKTTTRARGRAKAKPDTITAATTSAALKTSNKKEVLTEEKVENVEGRGRKNKVENNVEAEVKEKSVPVTKGRAKKGVAPKNDKKGEEVDHTAPKVIKGGGKKMTLPNSDQEELKSEEPVSRGRKKKELENDSEPKKRSRKVKSATPQPELAQPAAPLVEEEVVAPATTKRGRGKRAAIAADVEAQLDSIVEEIVPPIEKKAKKEPKMKKTVATVKGKSTPSKDIELPVDAELQEKPVEVKSRGRKRAAPKDIAGIENEKTVPGGDGKPAATKKAKQATKLQNATDSNYQKSDFELPADGEVRGESRYNLKISSWNVAGLRSWLKKDGLKYFEYEQPDIFCMQETKCANDQLPEEVMRISGYHPYWLCMPGGYAGVAIYSKIMPINVEYGIGNVEFDDVGRMITAEYEKFFLVNVYVPNSGRKLVNLDLRMRWEKLFQEYVKKLDALKPVVICGDMNVSHLEIDLANPKSNTRNAGFTKEEREKMTELLNLGFVDTFRHLYPDRTGAYTFWTYMANARVRNVGWRLDYFIVSERLLSRVVDNRIRSHCMGSDHCPITLFLKL